jgi:hypothetical protein
MTALMQKSIRESISNVMNQIRGVDEGLASLFGNISERFFYEKKRREESERDGMRRNKDIVKGTLDGIGIRGAINTIPFGEETDECFEKCVAIAFGKLNCKYGFNQIAEEVKNHWFSCSRENCSTLIVTYAWDITDFDYRHKDAFDNYTSIQNKDNIKHTVAVVLYGDYGPSLQYLK